MPPSVWTIWVLAGVLGAAGIALVLWARLAGAAGMRVRAPQVGRVGGRCCGCGYSTDGLEQAICPECGGGFAAMARRVERRRRGMLAAIGCMGIGCGVMGFPAVEAARCGWAHVAPNAVLIEVVRWSPACLDAIGAELQVRADAGMLRGWERRELARVCEQAMARGLTIMQRREAAWVLARVGAEAGDGTILAMLRDSDARVRAEGVRAAAGARAAARGTSPWICKRLMTLASSDRSALVRKYAVDAMRTVSAGSEGQSTLTAAMNDPNDGVRRRALLGLSSGVWDDRVAGAAATMAAADADEEIRWMAMWVLSHLGERPRAAMGAISEGLADASPVVRSGAVWALGSLHERAAGMLPLLAGMAIGDEDACVRGAAMEAIRTIRGEGASV